jgi:imidazolonepropionase-like amidohydrolase
MTSSNSTTEHTPVFLKGATVFDGTAFREDLAGVLIEGGRLTVLPHAAEHAVPPTATSIDLTGSTLAPGLIDTHVHMTTSTGNALSGFADPFSLQFYRSVQNLAATLHTGVTTVRDAGGADAGTRQAVEEGIIQGPRLRVAITLMTQTGGHGDGWLPSGASHPLLGERPGRPSGIADGVEEVRKVTRSILRAGADQIKICSTGGVMSPGDDPQHSQFSPEEIRVIVEEAEAQGKYVMAHAQGTKGIANALHAGVRSIEHGIYLDEQTAELMLDRGAYLVPTLMAPMQVVRMAEQGVPMAAGVVEKARAVIDRHRQSVSLAASAGVPIAMGTDSGVGPHGVNLDELALLEDCGLSVAAALGAATSVAAELMKIGDIGKIADGAAADLVVFSGDLREEGLQKLSERVTGVWKSGVRVR